MGTKIGDLLRKIFKFMKNVYEKLDQETKLKVKLAINIVEAVKKVMDSPVGNILPSVIKIAIPGDADDKLIDKGISTINEWIPKILLGLNLIDTIANIEDQNEKMKAILAQLKVSPKDTQKMYYHNLASLIIEKLSDGKLTWSESISIGEYYYKNILKK